MASDFDVLVEINGDDSGLTKALKNATNKIASFGYKLNGSITEGLVDPAKKAKVEFKDVTRIVAGIIISKTFYSGLNAIRNATDAVKEFNVELEYTKTAFSNLFNSADLASEFVNVLKDFSAVSPFGFTDSSKAAQQLLAYGIQYKNVMYVMQGVMDAATMMGDPAKIESISRALGQIYTKGTLKGEEVRQLAEAGVPAYEILQEKLKLTSEAMQEISEQAIPASVAINALVDGIHERFGGMTKASAKTMKGMVSNIKDNMLMLASGVFEPLYERMRLIVHEVDVLANKLRELFDLKGIGGVFEYLVPNKRAQAELRQFIAIVQELWHIVSYGLKNGLVVLRDLLLGVIHIINTIGPVLISVAQVIALVLRELSKCEPLMKALAYLLVFNASAWVAFRVAALGAKILSPITQLILNCAKALGILGSLIVAHPLTAGIIILTGAVAALGLAHSKAGEQVKEFFRKLTAWNGVDPGKQLLPETKKRTADLEKFNEKLDGTADALDKTGDEAEKAAKKGKKAQRDLLSFDEVFRLMQPDEDENDDIKTPGWEMPDFDLGLDDLDMSGIIPDFADLAAFDFDKQLDKLKSKIKALWEKFKKELPGVLAGAGLGALIGALIGGPLGAILGAAAGALVGYFWDKFADLIGINDKQQAAIAGALIGGFMALVAALTGLPAIGVALAGLAGFFGGLLWEKIAEAFGLDGAKKYEAAISSGIGAAFGAIIGGLLGGPVGAVIGAFIGTFVGEFWSIFADKVGLTEGAKFAGLIGAGIVAVLELAVKHASPLAAASAALLAANWISALVQAYQTGDWSRLLTVFTSTLGRLAFGPIGSMIGTLIGNLYDITYDALVSHFGISNAYRFNDVLVAGVSAALSAIPAFVKSIAAQIATEGAASLTAALKGGAKAGFIGFVASLASSALSNLLIDWLAKEFDLTKEDVEAGKTFAEIGGLIGAIVGTFFGPLGTAIGTAVGTLAGTIIGAFAGQDILGWFHSWWDPFAADAVQVIVTFFTQTIPGAWNTFVAFINSIITTITTFFSNIANAVVTFFTQTIPNAWNTFIGWLVSIPANIAAWFGKITSDIAYWLGYITGTIAKLLYNLFQSVVQFFTVTIPTAWNNFIAWLQGLPAAISAWFRGILQNIQTFFSNIGNAIVVFFTQTIPNAWNAFIAALRGVPGPIALWFAARIRDLQQFFTTVSSALYTFFTQTLPTAWTNFITWLQGLPAAISTWFTNLVQSIQTFFVTIATAVVGFFTQTIPNAWNAFITWLQGIPAAIGAFFTNLVQQFFTWGAALIQGLINGVMSIWQGITSWIDGLVQSFTRGFTDGWMIHSPSEVFFNIGANLIQGLLNGITATWATLTEFVSGIVTGLVDIFTTAFTNISTTVSGWVSTAGEAISSFVTNAGTSLTTWISNSVASFVSWASSTAGSIASFATTAGQTIASWATTAANNVRSFATQAAQKVSSFAQTAASNISSFASTTASKISSWVSSTVSSIGSWVSQTTSNIGAWATNTASSIGSWVTQTTTSVNNWVSSVAASIGSWVSQTADSISGWVSNTASMISSWASQAGSAVSGWAVQTASMAFNWASSFTSAVSNAMAIAGNSISDFVSMAASAISGWAANAFNTIYDVVSNAASIISSWASSAFSTIANVVSNAVSAASSIASLPGHATGGIFNREHIARVSEGNKPEAIIPLQDAGAMQPFVDAVAGGLSQYLGPVLANMQNSMQQAQPAYAGANDALPPMYVGTLIADDRSLRELERKMRVIRLSETNRTANNG